MPHFLDKNMMKKNTPKKQSNLPSSPARDGFPVTSPTLTPSLSCTRRFTRRVLPLLYLFLILSSPFFTGCHSQQHVVEIVKTDTLHTFHHDTIMIFHRDTIFSTTTTVQHDSVMLKEKETYYIDAATGEVLHSEKEKEKESYHNSAKETQFIQHTIDSLVQAKVDSIYASKHEEKPVIVEVQKELPWYQKIWHWIQGKLAYLAIFVIIIVASDYLFRPFLSSIKNKISIKNKSQKE